MLVSHAQRSYLVSARHVIERVRDPGSLYHYVERRQLARLFGHILHTAPEPGAIAPERFDLAVVRLLQEAAPPYPSLGKSALPSRFLAASTLPRSNKEYLVTGFPKSKSRANPVTKRLLSEPSAFRVESASVDAYQSMQLSQTTHLIMGLDVANMRFPDGTYRAIADPHGMSGCPVWITLDEARYNDPQSTYVVAFAIEYHKNKKLLVATDAGVALELLERDAA